MTASIYSQRQTAKASLPESRDAAAAMEAGRGNETAPIPSDCHGIGGRHHRALSSDRTIARHIVNTCSIKWLIAALCFHQMFEGIGLGGCILQAELKLANKAAMVFFFSVFF